MPACGCAVSWALAQIVGQSGSEGSLMHRRAFGRYTRLLSAVVTPVVLLCHGWSAVLQVSNLMGCLTTYGIGSAPPYFGAGYVPQGDWLKVRGLRATPATTTSTLSELWGWLAVIFCFVLLAQLSHCLVVNGMLGHSPRMGALCSSSNTWQSSDSPATAMC